MTLQEWFRIGSVLAALLIALPLIRTLCLKTGASPEVARKSVHVALGLICMCFPWIFDRALPVWTLAALATLPLAILRLVPGLRQGIGSALHGISRPSYGEVLFAPAVAMVFDYANGSALLHVIPIAILTLADAAGALAGTRWGRLRYAVGDGFKSVEGSLTVLATAFLCVFFPLWLGGAADALRAFWIATVLATLAMMAEGISDRGFDNLVIPVFCVFILERLLRDDTTDLIWRVVVLAAVLVIVMATSRWSTLSGGALLGGALLAYGCAILGGWQCAVPPLAVFGSHLLVTWRNGLKGVFTHRLDAVISHGIGCLPWTAAVSAGLLPWRVGLAGVALAMMAQLAILNARTRETLGHPPSFARSVAKGALFAVLPVTPWLIPLGSAFPLLLALAMGLSWLAIWVVNRYGARLREKETTLWLARGILTLVPSLPALLPLSVEDRGGKRETALAFSAAQEVPGTHSFRLNATHPVVTLTHASPAEIRASL